MPPLYAASDGCFKASFRPRQGPKRPEKGVRTLKKEEKTVFSRRTRIVRHLQTPPAVGDQDGTQTNGMNFAQACATGLSTVHLRAPSKVKHFCLKRRSRRVCRPLDERRHEEAFESPSRRFAFEESDADSLKGESTIVKAGVSDTRRRVREFSPDRAQNRASEPSVFRRGACKNEESAFQKAFEMTRGFRMTPPNHLKNLA